MDVAKYLVENGVDINLGDSYGSTPLILASCMGNVDMVRSLLNLEKIRYRDMALFCINLPNKHGYTALSITKEIAETKGKGGERDLDPYEKITQMLVEAGAR